MPRDLLPGVYLLNDVEKQTQICIDLCEFFAAINLPNNRRNVSLVLSAVQSTLQALGGCVVVELAGDAQLESEVDSCR